MEALCFSQHLFPLLPFIVATQGDREGTQILLGSLEWVSCGDWNHGEQGAGMTVGAATSGKLSCASSLSPFSLVKEMKQLLRRRNKLPTSAWNLLLSDSSALGTLKTKRSNSCSKKDLLECAELHSLRLSTETHRKGEGAAASILFPSPERRGQRKGIHEAAAPSSPPHLHGETLVVKSLCFTNCLFL